MPSTLYRDATLQDCQALTEIGRDTFVETFGHLYAAEDLAQYLAQSYSDAVQRRELEDEDTHFHLAQQDGRLVGYCTLRPCELPLPTLPPKPAWELHRLYVRRECWQQGIGRVLMEYAMRWFAARGAASIFLGVYSDNVRARKFYAHYGFEKVSEYTYPVGNHNDREFILQWMG